MPVGLKDVAAHAGVSAMTVSNVISGRGRVSAHTRERVERAIAELGYRPNPFARSLAGGRSGVVALAVPEIDVPYFAELARHLIDQAERHGQTLLIEQTDARADRERELLSGIRPRLIDGLIMFPAALATEDIVRLSGHTPVVLFGGAATEPGPDHVVLDNLAAGRAATEHLIAVGRKRIAVIGPATEHRGHSEHPRLTGYRQALRAAGLRQHAELVRYAPSYHRADGERAMRELLTLRHPPDAVFCFSDLLAVGALRGAHAAGLSVPDDIAIMGFDDVEEARYQTPPLTSVRPNKPQIAKLVLDRLATLLTANAAASPEIMHADYELIRRASTVGA